MGLMQLTLLVALFALATCVTGRRYRSTQELCRLSGWCRPEPPPPLPPKASVSISYIGCYKDRKNPRAIQGAHKHFYSHAVIQKCAQRAKQAGNSIFAVEYTNECYTDRNAPHTYHRYGEAKGCRKGRGGSWKMSVYRVNEVDQCATDTHNCDKHADCENTPGGFICTCKNGFVGDGIKCRGKNPQKNTALLKKIRGLQIAVALMRWSIRRKLRASRRRLSYIRRKWQGKLAEVERQIKEKAKYAYKSIRKQVEELRRKVARLYREIHAVNTTVGPPPTNEPSAEPTPEPSTETPTEKEEPPTEPPTEPTTETPTEVGRNNTEEPSAEPTTEPSTETPTEKEASIPGPILGITEWGVWSKNVTCPSLRKVTGFRLKIEGESGSGDDTALNGIEFRCQGKTTTGTIEQVWGNWTTWKTCDNDGYVTELDLKGMPSAGDNIDDYGATNVRVKCSGGDEKVGGGLSVGKWFGYQSCPAKTFLCGAQAKIEGDQGKDDDTALNKIRMGCCFEKQEPSTEPPTEPTTETPTEKEEPSTEPTAEPSTETPTEKEGLRCKGIDEGCCTKADPCGVGDGDCDNNDQCKGSSICGKDLCAWGGTDDCCMDAPGLRCSGITDGCCTKADPCGNGDGDCDNKEECDGSLECGTNNCAWGGNDDCCFDTVWLSRLKSGLRCKGVTDGCCTKANPCGAGDGDCDNNDECVRSSICGTDNCAWGGNDDCCLPEECPRENGYVKSAEDSAIKLDNLNGNTTERQASCLAKCHAHAGSTGCMLIWNKGNQGCYVYTTVLDKANGHDKHFCWIFSKCRGAGPADELVEHSMANTIEDIMRELFL